MEYKITALSLQKRNRQRVNVYLDGEFAFGLARIVAAWLEVGQTITDEKIQALQAEDAREVAYQQAIKLLNYRARTESEIRKNLVERKTPDEVIADVMERLHRNGLLNDANFARDWVENRSELRPRSRQALAFELRQRGIDREVIDAAVEQLDDEELAYQAALQQSRKLRNLEWQDFRHKMYSFLARRGFNYEVSSTAARRVWEELQGDEPYEDNSDGPRG